jgi:nucleotide-binding universal stress UspA family protein
MTATGPTSHSRIVVGVDASEPSKEALRWATAQAELTGSELEVVMSWDTPTTAYWAPLPESWNLEEATSAALDETVRETLGDSPRIEVTTTVVKGRAAPVLLERAHDAELLVVGSRGHGGFTGLLIGSVSGYCVAHARCPVVVVHPPHHR